MLMLDQLKTSAAQFLEIKVLLLDSVPEFCSSFEFCLLVVHGHVLHLFSNILLGQVHYILYRTNFGDVIKDETLEYCGSLFNSNTVKLC